MKNPNPDPARRADIPVWNAEKWMYEDIVIGHRIRSIRRTLSEGELVLYCEHLQTVKYRDPAACGAPAKS